MIEIEIKSRDEIFWPSAKISHFLQLDLYKSIRNLKFVKVKVSNIWSLVFVWKPYK